MWSLVADRKYSVFLFFKNQSITGSVLGTLGYSLKRGREMVLSQAAEPRWGGKARKRRGGGKQARLQNRPGMDCARTAEQADAVERPRQDFSAGGRQAPGWAEMARNKGGDRGTLLLKARRVIVARTWLVHEQIKFGNIHFGSSVS